jgi:hypothetical protein
MKLTNDQAQQIAADYQWLIDQQFKSPHGMLRIDVVVTQDFIN